MSLCVIITIFPIFTAQAENAPFALTEYLPQETELNGWLPDDAPRIFEGEDLFSLIDGGAAMYLEYGFTRAATQTYTHPQKHVIDLQIFEMSDAAAAYGIYTVTSGDAGQPIPLGNAGKLESSYLTFWKGRFLVTVTGNDTDQTTLDEIMGFAKVVDANMQETGPPPQLPECLPQKPISPSSVKYIKGQMGLFNTTPFESGTVGDFAEGVVGIYNDVTVLILRYASENDGANVVEILKKNPRFTAFVAADHLIYFLNDRNERVVGTSFRDVLILVVGMSNDEGTQICQQIVENIRQLAQ